MVSATRSLLQTKDIMNLTTNIMQYLYYKSPHYLNLGELWTNWPQRELDGLTKVYILAQWAYWMQQVIAVNIEARRKDYWEMIVHHAITISLIAASYAYHQTRVGHLILVLMDIVELIFPVRFSKFVLAMIGVDMRISDI